jgi:hypothetical protein
VRGEQALRLQHVLQALGIVIGAAIERFTKGEEGDNLGFRFWAHKFDQRFHRNAAPLRDAAPALDAVMHGDVLDLSELSMSARESSTGFSTRPPTLILKSRNPRSARCFQSSLTGSFPLGQKYGEISCSEYVLLRNQPI